MSIFAVATGRQANVGQLGDITGDPLRVFPFSSDNLIKDVINRITKEFCHDVVGMILGGLAVATDSPNI